MAINFKDIKDELEKAPFSKEEFSVINKIETYIDKQIKENFDGNGLSFDTNVLDFKFNPDNTSEPSWNVFKEIKSTRKQLMTEELKQRYEIAGWKWRLIEGEDDGPNRPGLDYWLLRGK